MADNKPTTVLPDYTSHARFQSLVEKAWVALIGRGFTPAQAATSAFYHAQALLDQERAHEKQSEPKP